MKVTTVYPKGVKNPVVARNIMKPGSNNAKLGYVITKSDWKKKRLYSLTLTERDTCPTSCHHWEDCYGNNMPFAHRYSTEGLTDKLEQEIPILLNKHKHGIVVRLHVLGDFYSKDYVEFWEEQLLIHPQLCLFGYTARFENPIAKSIWLMNTRYNERCVIRWSGNCEYGEGQLNSRFAADESFEGKGFYCPEQTGKVKSCAECALCWMTDKTVIFRSH